MKDVSSLEVEMGGKDQNRPSKAWEAFNDMLIRSATDAKTILGPWPYGLTSRSQCGQKSPPCPPKESP